MPGAQAGFPVGSMLVSTRGMLMGLPVGLLDGTLGTDDCGCMEHVICLLSSIWGLGMLGGACILSPAGNKKLAGRQHVKQTLRQCESDNLFLDLCIFGVAYGNGGAFFLGMCDAVVKEHIVTFA